MMRRVTDRARGDRRSRLVWLFQAVDDPTDLLYAAVWSSAADYWRRLRAKPPTELDALCVAPPERHFFERLRTVEVVSQRAQAVDCLFVRVADASRTAAEQYLLEEAHRVAARWAGFVLHAVYRERDTPDLLFVMHGWESPAALERFRAAALPPLMQDLAALGAAATPFAGRVRAGAAGLPHGLYTWRL
jgi:quinol monooxygenase YgiN